jgi:hypothetical protein
MKKVSMVKVAMFRVVDQYTREDKCVVISKCSVSNPLREAKAFVNECLAKHFTCVAECEEKGPMPPAMADMLLAACQKANPCVLVFDMINEEEAAS